MGYKTAEAAQTKSVRLRMLLPHMVDESAAIIVEYRQRCKSLYPFSEQIRTQRRSDAICRVGYFEPERQEQSRHEWVSLIQNFDEPVSDTANGTAVISSGYKAESSRHNGSSQAQSERRKDGYLTLAFPTVPTHPNQAYTSNRGKADD